ncbi:hypothetical protein AW736_18805 [Termitidicoccus mucosus]|uniref:Uncharacterized protein n=1 Tax=Termitidicoccus mucosus TaxID=1184151 RepID=A0A178IDN0_9BACT|nr:hypothetical protein AW736_18805 [Opitutaceae bacterium TSB47]
MQRRTAAPAEKRIQGNAVPCLPQPFLSKTDEPFPMKLHRRRFAGHRVEQLSQKKSLHSPPEPGFLPLLQQGTGS